MADVNLTDHKTVGSMFSNAQELVRVQYDFDNDTGESDDDYMVLTAGDDVVITDFWIRGITECDSSGDGASIDIGIDGGDEDILIDGVAEATLAADALVQPTVVEGTPNVLPLPLYLPSASKIRMKILGEDLTAGKFEMVFVCAKFK